MGDHSHARRFDRAPNGTQLRMCAWSEDEVEGADAGSESGTESETDAVGDVSIPWEAYDNRIIRLLLLRYAVWVESMFE